jgi:hypothetical protein
MRRDSPVPATSGLKPDHPLKMPGLLHDRIYVVGYLGAVEVGLPDP